MTALVTTLYDYARNYRVDAFYSAVDECARDEGKRTLEKDQERLRGLCSDELYQRVVALRKELEQVHFIELEALFACGLSMGMELSRL